jgi:hypothetical protein
MKNFHIQIEGKDGLFNVEKSTIFFPHHVTTKSLKEDLQTVKKELAKMVKKGQVMVTLMDSDASYYRKDLTRIIYSQWSYNNTFELEVRPFNGTDYGTINKLNFVTMAQLQNYVAKYISELALNTLGNIPEDKTLYSSGSDNEEIVLEIE